MLFGPAKTEFLRGDVDDVAAHPLLDQHLRRGLRDQERALGHDVVLQVPVGLGGLQQRLRERQPGVVDHQVDARRTRARSASTIACTASASVTSTCTPTATSAPPISAAAACAFSRSRSAITTHAPSAASRCAIALPMPRRGAGDQRDPGGQRLGLRHPLELGLLERPVLDAELLRLVDRRVRRQPLGAAHHVDRVDVELAGHPGGLLVLAEAEHADAGHQHDQRVGAAHRRRVRRRVPLVVGRVVLAVGLVQLAQPGDGLLDRGASAGRSSTSGLTLVRRKWSGQEVPSAASRGCSARPGSRAPRRSR